jgi:hypothetical protein
MDPLGGSETASEPAATIIRSPGDAPRLSLSPIAINLTHFAFLNLCRQPSTICQNVVIWVMGATGLWRAKQARAAPPNKSQSETGC